MYYVAYVFMLWESIPGINVACFSNISRSTEEKTSLKNILNHWNRGKECRDLSIAGEEIILSIYYSCIYMQIFVKNVS